MESGIERLQRDLETFDRIFLFPDKGPVNMAEEFSKSRVMKRTQKKVLVLSRADISGRQKNILKHFFMNEVKVDWKRSITERWHKTVKNLYKGVFWNIRRF